MMNQSKPYPCPSRQGNKNCLNTRSTNAANDIKLENFITIVNAPKITQELGSFQYDEIGLSFKKMSFKYIPTTLIKPIKNKKPAL
ncbi:hypothetical protein CEV08_05290 [Bartonella tribocorum]|uniref:Uncharacterized protein n=1 Tax=Bartonella tribocorum TaxID=85701 RepID=A0A2M6UUQ6_9HYPH|nr:hypothetical protein CEV08_05290 [Bartonella tribocorum]